MNGGPSQVDTFDPKAGFGKICRSGLAVYAEDRTPHGCGASLRRSSFRNMASRASKSASFSQRGTPMNRRRGRHSLDACRRGPTTSRPLMLMNCGEARLVRPSLGSCADLRSGTENQNLPRLRGHVPRRLSDPGIAELAGRGFPCRASIRGNYVKPPRISKSITHRARDEQIHDGGRSAARVGSAGRALAMPSTWPNASAIRNWKHKINRRVGLPHADGSGRRLRR